MQSDKKSEIVILRYQGASPRGNWIPMIPARDLTQVLIDAAVEIYPETFKDSAAVLKYCEESGLYKRTRALTKDQ